MKMEMDGSIVGVITSLFWAVNSKKARAHLAEMLAKTDAKMSEAEDKEKAAAAAPVQAPAEPTHNTFLQPQVPQPQPERRL